MNEELNKLFEIKNTQLQEATDSNLFDTTVHLLIRIIIPFLVFFLLYSFVEHSNDIGIAFVAFFVSLFILFLIIVALLIEASNLNKKNKIHLTNINYILSIFYSLPFILILIITAINK